MQELHFVGNAHLDPVWLWRWPQGAAEIKATFLSALERMEETPGFIFTAGAVSYYEWVMENEPELFRRIEQRVAEGRWVPVGGWWVQPDCNLPSGESFARHSLLGQRFLKAHLGHPAKVGYNVDSFGHNAGLPQILNQSGMKYYVMMRPGEHEKHLPTVFWWEGPDGSRVLTHRIMGEYCSRPDGSDLMAKRDQYRAESQRLELPLMVFYGVGNHGGGPTAAALARLTEMMRNDTSLIFSDPERYFRQLEQQMGDKIPVIRGDLQHHASGCYSTDSPGKEANRRAEAELTDAEKMMSVAHQLLQLPYQGQEMTRAWKSLLFNQFHDIMGGCSIRPALMEAHDELGEARAVARRNLNRALQRIAFHIDTWGGRKGTLSKAFDAALWETEAGGAPLVVFNTLPWTVTGPVQVYGMTTRVEDETGLSQPTQMVRAARTLPGDGTNKHDTLFMATVPPMGYRIYRASRHLPAPAAEGPKALACGDGVIENEFFRVRADAASGAITEIWDKALGRNILAAPIRCLVIENQEADTWAHGLFTFREARGAFADGSVQLTETGPLRATMRLTSQYGASRLRLEVSLYPGQRRIALAARLLWLEEYAMAKLTVPLHLEAVQASWEQAYTVCQKQADGREVPAQCWGDVTGILPDGTIYGLALANDGRYSYEAMDGELRLTLARSAAYADHAGPGSRDGFNECMDLGEHRVGMLLLPHQGPWQQADIDRAAQELAHPLAMLAETYHGGELPERGSFAHVEGDGIRLTALKQAEDGDGYIVRLWESRGKPASGQVALDFLNAAFPVKMGPYQIASFRVRPNGEVIPVDLTEEEIAARP